MKRWTLAVSVAPFPLPTASCIKMKHEMTIQPIHVTVEVRVKIDKALDDFFSEIDGQKAPTAQKEENHEK